MALIPSSWTDSIDTLELDASFDETDAITSSVSEGLLHSVSTISDNSRPQDAPHIKSCKLWCQARAILLPVAQTGKISVSKLIHYLLPQYGKALPRYSDHFCRVTMRAAEGVLCQGGDNPPSKVGTCGFEVSITCWSKGGDTSWKLQKVFSTKAETPSHLKLELRFLKSVSLPDQKVETTPIQKVGT